MGVFNSSPVLVACSREPTAACLYRIDRMAASLDWLRTSIDRVEPWVGEDSSSAGALRRADYRNEGIAAEQAGQRIHCADGILAGG